MVPVSSATEHVAACTHSQAFNAVGQVKCWLFSDGVRRWAAGLLLLAGFAFGGGALALIGVNGSSPES
jgi:hypothetical protein